MSVVQMVPRMPVYVVDEHDEALACIHNALRSRILPWEFRLVHLDAHPDLTVVGEEAGGAHLLPTHVSCSGHAR